MDKKSTYTNKVTFSTNINEVMLKFERTEPVLDEKNVIVGNEIMDATIIYMSPQLAKSLIKIFNTAIEGYEKNFGNIPNEKIINKV